MARVAEKIKAYISMLRPEIAWMDLSLAAVSIVLAVITTGSAWPSIGAMVAVVAAAYCAIVGSYVFNDYVDSDIDAINLPDRALPSGKAQRWEALALAILLYVVGLVIFLFFDLRCVLCVLAATAIISQYSAYFKRRTPMSFVSVGLAYGMVPIGVWFAFAELRLSAFLLAAMICITDWGFTLSGVSRDVVGDEEKGAPTLPVTLGIPFTAKLVFVCWAIGVILSLVIGYLSGLWVIYFAAALLGGIWLLVKCYGFVTRPDPEVGGRLFLQASVYRGVLFSALIVDAVLMKCFSPPKELLFAL